MGKDKKLGYRCNQCGREFEYQGKLRTEDAFIGYKEWGYFSERDLEVHQFCLCEDCYNKLIETFAIPVDVMEKTEILIEKSRHF